MVGAVVVAGGEIVGRGWHRQAGGPHAEVFALEEAGVRARGATLYVTLEPCSHHGRTPPCADAVIAAGIRKVVACHADPNPRVAGQGFEKLRAAGIEVEVGEMALEAARLNFRFLTPLVAGRPAVTLKWAMSLDGRIATASGESQWISSPAGRRWALALREEHDATLVGIGTVLADDPLLNRRLGLAAGAGTRVVLDRKLRTPPMARLFTDPSPVLIYTERGAGEERQALEERGAVVVALPKVEPQAVLADLYSKGIQSVLVEGGGEALASFAAAGAFDRVAVCTAPLLIGGRGAPGPLGGEGAARLVDAARLEEMKAARRGPDVLLTGFRAGWGAEIVKSTLPPTAVGGRCGPVSTRTAGWVIPDVARVLPKP